jgi:hypothetical protein
MGLQRLLAPTPRVGPSPLLVSAAEQAMSLRLDTPPGSKPSPRVALRRLLAPTPRVEPLSLLTPPTWQAMSPRLDTPPGSKLSARVGPRRLLAPTPGQALSRTPDPSPRVAPPWLPPSMRRGSLPDWLALRRSPPNPDPSDQGRSPGLVAGAGLPRLRLPVTRRKTPPNPHALAAPAQVQNVDPPGLPAPTPKVGPPPGSESSPKVGPLLLLVPMGRRAPPDRRAAQRSPPNPDPVGQGPPPGIETLEAESPRFAPAGATAPNPRAPPGLGWRQIRARSRQHRRRCQSRREYLRPLPAPCALPAPDPDRH